MKIIFDGTGEDVEQIISWWVEAGVDVEQKDLPTSCPDLVSGISELGGEFHAQCMVEVKWSTHDFMTSYRSGHLQSQLLYMKKHCNKGLLAIVKTSVPNVPMNRNKSFRKQMAMQKAQYEGMIQDVMVDFNVPVKEFKTPQDLIIWSKRYIQKSMSNLRVYMCEEDMPPLFKGDINTKTIMCVRGIGKEVACRLMDKYHTDAELCYALSQYECDVDGVGLKTKLDLIDNYIERGHIEKGYLPWLYLFDLHNIRGADRRYIKKQFKDDATSCSKLLEYLQDDNLSEQTINIISKFFDDD